MAELKFALKSKNLVDAGTESDPPLETAEFVYSGDIAELKGVAIELLEVDQDAGTKAKPKKSQSLAKFTANIEPDPAPTAGKAPGVLKLTKKPKPGLKKEVPRFKVRFANEDFEIGLPGLDREAGRRFEIQLVAKAKQTVKVAGKKKPEVTELKFESQALLFARFGHFKNEPKAPVITFVTGAEDGGFFEAATTFWRQHADVVVAQDGMSLQEIAQFLANVSTQILSETGNQGWGEVNIVCHGNSVAALIKILRSSTNRDLRSTELDKVLAAQPTAFAVGPLGLTATSRVVFRACNIGHRPDLLARVKQDVFAGACEVFAPKFLQFYSAQRKISTGQAREAFVEEVTVHFPLASKPTDAVADVALTARFAKQQAQRNISPAQAFAAEKGTFTIRKSSTEKNNFSFPAAPLELQLTLQSDRKTLLSLEQQVASNIDAQKGTDAFLFADSAHWKVGPFTGKRKVTADMEIGGQSGTTTAVRAIALKGGVAILGSDAAFLAQVTGDVPVQNRLHSPAASIPTGAVLQLSNKAPTFQVTDQNGSVVGSGSVAGEAVTTLTIGGETLEVRRSHSVTAGAVPFQRTSVSFRRDLKDSNSAIPFAQRAPVIPNIDNPDHYGSSADPAPTPTELADLAD